MLKKVIVMLLCLWSIAHGQIPVEVFSGDERSTLDVMFFKFVKNQEGQSTPWLFFSRNRAAVDYRITETTYLPQFGSTNAISYNAKQLRGFAPVYVGQILSWGIYSKAGLQYAHTHNHVTVFTWAVCTTTSQPDLDYFLLFRYQPPLTNQLSLFTQVESVNTLPTDPAKARIFTQRLRLGFSAKGFQFGFGADFNQSGVETYTRTENIGAFIRHEF